MSGESLAGGFKAAAVAEPIAALIAFGIVAVLFVYVKWGMSHSSKIRERELEIERYRVEVQEKADAALDDRERERIRTTQRQIAAQEESTRAIEALSVQVAATNAQLEDSKVNSREMGGRVVRIDETTSHTAQQVEEIHAMVVRQKEPDGRKGV